MRLRGVVASQRALDAAIGVETTHHCPELDRRRAPRAVGRTARGAIEHNTHPLHWNDDGTTLAKTLAKRGTL